MGEFSFFVELSLFKVLTWVWVSKDALSRVYTSSREQFSRHFCKEVPTGRVTVGMASLYLESLRGVHAHLKPLQASVEVSTEHAPPTGTVCKGKSCPL